MPDTRFQCGGPNLTHQGSERTVPATYKLTVLDPLDEYQPDAHIDRSGLWASCDKHVGYAVKDLVRQHGDSVVIRVSRIQ